MGSRATKRATATALVRLYGELLDFLTPFGDERKSESPRGSYDWAPCGRHRPRIPKAGVSAHAPRGEAAARSGTAGRGAILGPVPLVPYWFIPPAPVVDALGAVGVPHGEVDLVLVNGEVAELSDRLTGGERVAVFPPFRDLSPARARGILRGPLRFLVDVHLARLARILRIAGFDVRGGEERDDRLASIAFHEERVLLSRDRELLKRRAVTRCYAPRSSEPEQQAREVLDRFDARGLARPFTRCPRCNGVLELRARSTVRDDVPKSTWQTYLSFSSCNQCGTVYWQGAHRAGIESMLERLGIPLV